MHQGQPWVNAVCERQMAIDIIWDTIYLVQEVSVLDMHVDVKTMKGNDTIVYFANIHFREWILWLI